MALKELKYIYQASGLTSARNAIAQFDDIAAGTIKEIHIHAPNVASGTHKFAFAINGTGQFEPENYFTITAADKQDSKTGLSIAVAQYDLLQFDYKTNGANLISPIYFTVVIDDGLVASVDAGDVTVDDSNFSVITGTDAQTALDSVDDELAALDQDISDVDAKTLPSGGTAGQVLAKIDSTDYNTEWVNQSGGGGASALDDLTDVVISSPSNGEVLTYNGSEWVNAPASGGGGGSMTPPTVFADDFNDNSIDAAKWVTPAETGVSETGGVIQIARGPGASKLKSLNTFSFYDKDFAFEIISISALSNTLVAQIGIASADAMTDFIGFILSGGNLRCYNNNSFLKGLTYNPVNHKFCRFICRNASVSYQVSADGITWNTVHHVASSVNLDAMYLYFSTNNNTGDLQTVEIDNLKVRDWANLFN